MTATTRTQAMLAARAKASHDKRQRVLAAVQALEAAGTPVTPAAVAAAARVSTWLVYANGVREHVQAASATARSRRISFCSRSSGMPLTGHEGRVRAVAVGRLPDGTPVIVSGSEDGTVRVWRLADGAPVEEPPRGHAAGVEAVAVGALPDGNQVVVSGGYDGAVRVWRLADGTPVGWRGRHADRVRAVAVGALADGTPVIVSGSEDVTRLWHLLDGAPHPALLAAVDDHGTVQVWRLADGTPVGRHGGLHTGTMSAVAIGRLPEGTPVIISGEADRSAGGAAVWVWRLAAGPPVGEPLRGHAGSVNAVAVGALPDGTPVIISGGDDGTVRVWRLADGTPVWWHDRRRARRVLTVAAGALPDGTPVIISGGSDGTVRVWRGRRHPGRRAADRPRGPSAGGGGRAAGRWHSGHRQRERGRHGAGVAAGRWHPARASAEATPISSGCRRLQQRDRHCGRDRHRRPPANAPARHALTAVLFPGTVTGR